MIYLRYTDNRIVGVPSPETTFLGRPGDTGATGATGAAGPNLVNGSTTTTLTGFLKGNGSLVSAQTSPISASDIDTAIARLASPTFTGVPAAPTAANGTNTTQIATTAFVLANSAVPEIGGTITGGTVGNVLFVGAGPVFAQSTGLQWDDTNKRLYVGLPGGTTKQRAYFKYHDEILNEYPAVVYGGSTLAINIGDGEGTGGNAGRAYLEIIRDNGGVPLWQIGFNSVLPVIQSQNTLAQINCRFFGHPGGSQQLDFYPAGGSVGIIKLRSAFGSGGATLSSPPASFTVSADATEYSMNSASSRSYKVTCSGGSWTWDGMNLFAGGEDGQEFEFWIVGSNNLTLKHESASATASRRFICGTSADIVATPGSLLLFRVDLGSSRIRVWKVA